MNLVEQTTVDQRRHRVLDAALTRLTRLPDADQFVLRGGMLLRQWFHSFDRPAADIDLVSLGQFDVQQITEQLLPILSVDGVRDQIKFDRQRYRIQPIWTNTDFPGIRMFLRADTGGVAQAIHIDVTFGESLVPVPMLGDFRLDDGVVVQLKLCRPEAIAARKLHALADMGMRHWRPKDLNDIRLLLDHMEIDDTDLIAGIDYSFSSRGDPTTKARSMFSNESWWSTRTASARWHDYVSQCQNVPHDLDSVVGEVRERLHPVMQRLS